MDDTDHRLSTAVVQRNIKHILDGAKSQHLLTQSAAMDILAFTVKNMLYHPIEVSVRTMFTARVGADRSACRS